MLLDCQNFERLLEEEATLESYFDLLNSLVQHCMVNVSDPRWSLSSQFVLILILINLTQAIQEAQDLSQIVREAVNSNLVIFWI